MMKPTRLRGFSDAYGSWKIIIISRRIGLISARERFVMSRSSKTIFPPVGSSSRMMQRASVDLPQPDSPTMPSVSPRSTLKLTPSTAFTEAISFWKMMPRVTGKYFWRSSTTRSSLAISASPRRRAASLARFRHRRRQHLLPLLVLRLLREVTGLQMPARVLRRRELRFLALADVHHEGAARVEPASGRRVQQRGRLAADLREALDVAVESRQRAEQPPGVRVLRPGEDLVHGSPLDDLGGVHHDDVVGRLG